MHISAKSKKKSAKRNPKRRKQGNKVQTTGHKVPQKKCKRCQKMLENEDFIVSVLLSPPIEIFSFSSMQDFVSSLRVFLGADNNLITIKKPRFVVTKILDL